LKNVGNFKNKNNFKSVAPGGSKGGQVVITAKPASFVR
jgi:hypothetical protein